jgi:hypothetical protein
MYIYIGSWEELECCGWDSSDAFSLVVYLLIKVALHRLPPRELCLSRSGIEAAR